MRGRRQDAIKRLIDVVLAAAGLLLSSPVTAMVAVTVRIAHGSPIFYWQLRAGRGGSPFRIVKFRTMTDECDADGHLLPDSDRMTTVGRFLRASSLDEIPELWNVLRGDMSLVGPRPLPVSYLTRFTEREARRHEVRPGITGLAQISGRNALSWDERLELDVVYVDTRSTLGDLKILAVTVIQVLARRGITAEGHATMPELRPSYRPGLDRI